MQLDTDHLLGGVALLDTHLQPLPENIFTCSGARCWTDVNALLDGTVSHSQDPAGTERSRDGCVMNLPWFRGLDS